MEGITTANEPPSPPPTTQQDAKATTSPPEAVDTPKRRLRERRRTDYSEDHTDVILEDILGQFETGNDDEAAYHSGLPPDQMTTEEQQEFPEFAEVQDAYLQIRNHVIALWRNNMNEYLTKQKATQKIQEKYHDLVEEIHAYLTRAGWINLGIFSTANKTPKKAATKRKVIVVGAGMAGLACARQLGVLGYDVTVLEARDRPGGRVFTESNLAPSCPYGIDMGASVVTGIYGNPVNIVCQQLGIKLYHIGEKCPIFDEDGTMIPPEVDSKVESEFNLLLDQTSALKKVPVNTTPVPEHYVSLGKGLRYMAVQRYKNGIKPETTQNSEGAPVEGLTRQERSLMNWHFANLDYACAAELDLISLSHWDQDDLYELPGGHYLVPEGYGYVAWQLAKGLDLHYATPVSAIDYSAPKGVQVVTTTGKTFSADAVVVTIPLGILKQGSVKFNPALPDWKMGSMNRLGFGLLNKVALVFPETFWDTSADYFGYTRDAGGLGLDEEGDGNGDRRGEFYLCWNLYRCVGLPVLVALMAGKSAHDSEAKTDTELVDAFMTMLRKQYGPGIPEPTKAYVSRWKAEEYSKGTYSYVAVGATGEDYDIMAKPVENKVFWAGEATCREHPATVAGAFISGLREAARIDSLFAGKRIPRFYWIAEESKKNARSGQKRKKRKEHERKTMKGCRYLPVRSRVNPEVQSFLSSYKIPKRKKIKKKKPDANTNGGGGVEVESPRPSHEHHSDGATARTNTDRDRLSDSRRDSNSYAQREYKFKAYAYKSSVNDRYSSSSEKNRNHNHKHRDQETRFTDTHHDQNYVQKQTSQQPASAPTPAPAPTQPAATSPQLAQQQQILQAYLLQCSAMLNAKVGPTPTTTQQLIPPLQQLQHLQQLQMQQLQIQRLGIHSQSATQQTASPESAVQGTPIPLQTFRDKVSEVIVERLSKYMKQGSIVSKEEFKKLARKLTHTVITKEQKHQNSAHELVLTNKIHKKVKKLVDNHFGGKSKTPAS